MILKIIFFIIITVGLSEAQLPSYLKRCDIYDDYLDSCILQSAQYALPYIFNNQANSSLKARTSYPIVSLTVQSTDNVKFIFNGRINFADLNIANASINFYTNTWGLIITGLADIFTLNYTATDSQTANILETGEVIIIDFNFTFSYTGIYNFITINNEQYMEIINSAADFNYEEFIFYMFNRKNTDNSEDQIDTAMRNTEQSFKIYVENIGPNIIDSVFNSILRLVPADQIFLV